MSIRLRNCCGGIGVALAVTGLFFGCSRPVVPVQPKSSTEETTTASGAQSYAETLTAATPYEGIYQAGERASGGVFSYVRCDKSGKRGDLPQVLEKNPDLPQILARTLATNPQETSEWRDKGQHGFLALGTRVLGARISDGHVEFFLLQDAASFYLFHGRLASGAASWSLAQTIVVEDSQFRIESVEEAQDGDLHASSIKNMMPAAIAKRALNERALPDDSTLLYDSAVAWVERTGQWPETSAPEAAPYVDKHHHVPDIYRMAQLPAHVHGIHLKPSEPPAKSGPADGFTQENTELVSRSADKAWDCFVMLQSGNLLFHKVSDDTWYLLTGLTENLLHQRQWRGHTLIFDEEDVGYNPEYEPISGVHIEVNLDTLTVERVIPFGPHSVNGQSY